MERTVTMKTIVSNILFLFVFAALVHGAVDHNPLNNGTTLSRNALGCNFEAALHNPALSGVERIPIAGLSVPGLMFGTGIWSDKLAISPFNRYWVDSLRESSALITKVLKKSFDLDGLTPEEVSRKLTEELKGGIGIYTGFRMSLINFGMNRFAFDVTTHIDEESRIPEGPLMAVFSETDGLRPDKSLDFTDLRQDGIWATDFSFSMGMPFTFAPVNDFLRLRHGSVGAGVKYVMGHSILKASADRGSIYFDTSTNSYVVDAEIDVRTAGLGLSGPWRMESMFKNGLPVSGHGFGIDLGGILYDKHGTLSVSFNNLGCIFWTNSPKGKVYRIRKDDLDLYDIIDGVRMAENEDGDPLLYIFNKPSDEIPDENDTLENISTFATALPMALNIGYSWSWDYSDNSLRKRLLAQYVNTTANYEQALARSPGRRAIPRLSMGAEAGTMAGYLPLRMGFVFGGAEKVASTLGLGIDCRHADFNISYKAIGTPVFVPKRGFELAVGLRVSWGRSLDADNDSIQDRDDACRLLAEDRDGFEDKDGCPEFDNDADSIPDTLDKCINNPEDYDNFEDTDGCPDPDNDSDSIPDTLDKCPMVPEDRDGFEDTNGCPDFDNDIDGIPDTLDKCMDHPEDLDKFMDEDGCPDPDNDSDSVADSIDACPDQAEILNGLNDSDGCPDTLVLPTEEETMKLNTSLQSINFKTGSAELTTASFVAIDSIAEFLKFYASLRYEVQGHTDSQGVEEKNLLLSAARAAAICSSLVSKGVPQERIIAVGYGETMPVADNGTREGRSKNRRVEFKTIETDGDFAALRAREAELREKLSPRQ